jgi:hypothetical protein
MLPRAWLWLAAAGICGAAALPTPEQHLGFRPGADYQLAGYQEIIGYFQTLAASSDRIRLADFGRSAHGKSTFVAFLSSRENLQRLDRYREIQRRLALGEATAEEAARLAKEGRAIVWIDSGLHASEVAPVQHAPELAYRILTDESAEARRIRDEVILLQVPVINPDGLDWIVEWYRRNRGTPYELAPLPRLYQKYAGHDNNRDWFMLNLPETRNATRLLFQEWFPHIVYNQHQQPAFPARIFVPPYAEPLNPHIPAAVLEGIHLIGSAMKERLALERKPGVLSYFGFDAWWNGGLRSTPAFHNMHGILTETAANVYAEPRDYDAAKFPAAFANGVPTREPSVFYPNPWRGGRWTLRDAIEYMLTADIALLHLAATRREEFVMKAWRLAREAIESPKPYAYVISRDQWDRSAAPDMLERMAFAGVRVERAAAAFSAGGKTYPAGSFVVRAGQPFRPYLMDLLEPQKYPELKSGQDGPTRRPYDIAGWTLPMLMGVQVDRLEEPFTAQLTPVASWPLEGAVEGEGPVALLDARETSAYRAVAALLARGQRVAWSASGEWIVAADAGATALANEFGIRIRRAAQAPPARYELRPPRAGLYESWVANMDAGWTQFVFDRFQIPYTLLHNEDIRAGALRGRLDVIVLPSQTTSGILHGVREGETIQDRNQGARISTQRPEYSGGIGIVGLARLEEFVREGGTLVALDQAGDLLIDHFPLPVRNAVRSGDRRVFDSPGSLLRMSVDTAHPLAFGMPAAFMGFSTGAAAYEITLAPAYNHGERETRAMVRFAEKDLLASGWLSGERAAAGRSALVEARHGEGRVLLFGFRPQFRGQTAATFRLLLNAVYLASARPAGPPAP